MARIEDLVSAEDRQAIERMAQGNQAPLEAEAKEAKQSAQDVEAGMPANAEKRGNKPRRPRAGPMSHLEVADRLHDAQALKEEFTETRFVAGIMSLIAADFAADSYQRLLGEFVVKYKNSPADVQASVRLALAGQNDVVPRFENASAIQQLLETIFWNKPDMFVKGANRQTLAEKRCDNWVAKYNKDLKEKILEQNETVQEQRRAAGVISIADAVAGAETFGLAPGKPLAPKAAKAVTKRQTAYDVLGEMYYLAGAKTNSIEKAREYRTFILNAARDIGLDDTKLESAINKVIERSFNVTKQAGVEVPADTNGLVKMT